MPQPTLDPQTEQPIRRRTTNLIKLQAFYDDVSGTFPTDAVVACTLYDQAGVAHPDVTNLPMPYVAGTARFNTTYRGVIPAGTNYADVRYTARITATRLGAAREYNVGCPVIDG